MGFLQDTYSSSYLWLVSPLTSLARGTSSLFQFMKDTLLDFLASFLLFILCLLVRFLINLLFPHFLYLGPPTVCCGFDCHQQINNSYVLQLSCIKGGKNTYLIGLLRVQGHLKYAWHIFSVSERSSKSSCVKLNLLFSLHRISFHWFIIRKYPFFSFQPFFSSPAPPQRTSIF